MEDLIMNLNTTRKLIIEELHEECNFSLLTGLTNSCVTNLSKHMSKEDLDEVYAKSKELINSKLEKAKVLLLSTYTNTLTKIAVESLLKNVSIGFKYDYMYLAVATMFTKDDLSKLLALYIDQIARDKIVIPALDTEVILYADDTKSIEFDRKKEDKYTVYIGATFTVLISSSSKEYESVAISYKDKKVYYADLNASLKITSIITAIPAIEFDDVMKLLNNAIKLLNVEISYGYKRSNTLSAKDNLDKICALSGDDIVRIALITNLRDSLKEYKSVLVDNKDSIRDISTYIKDSDNRSTDYGLYIDITNNDLIVYKEYDVYGTRKTVYVMDDNVIIK